MSGEKLQEPALAPLDFSFPQGTLLFPSAARASGLVEIISEMISTKAGANLASKARPSSPHSARRGLGQDICLPWLHTRTRNAAYCLLAAFAATVWGHPSRCVLAAAPLEGTLVMRLQISKSGSPDVEDLPQRDWRRP